MPDAPPPTRWLLPTPDPAAIAALAAAANVPHTVAELLLARGISTSAAAADFFSPTLASLLDPYLMLGMSAAVARIQHAVAHSQPILIYGDYDVDGTTAIVLLKTAIERLPTPTGSPADVRFHVPHRLREGYGMQSSVLADYAAAGVRLVVSVDTGVRAFAAADEARRLSLDLIVTDHHLPDDDKGIPDALAVLNPNQPGCTYPNKELCGAGVAFKLAQALLSAAAATPDERDRLHSRLLPSFLKMLAIATIADSVPLRGENRAIAAIGLRELLTPSQPGLRELMRLADLDPATRAGRPFTTTEVGFRIAPRINAAGRMDNASEVVELFLTRDPARATALADKLNSLNEDRRASETAALSEIDDMLANSPQLAESPIVVLLGHTWHRGVVGILASRVVDRLYRPALIFTDNPHIDDESANGNAEGVAHGSGRSIAGFHLLDALTAVDAMGPPLFTRFGGHAYAVGCALPSALVDELRARLAAYAADRLTPQMLTRTVDCHAELTLDRITPALYQWLSRFEPTGAGNPAPVLVARNLTIASPLRVLKEKHLKLRLTQGSAAINCMAWNWAERAMAMQLSAGSLVDVAFTLRENTHPDFGGLEIELVDIHLSKAI